MSPAGPPEPARPRMHDLNTPREKTDIASGQLVLIAKPPRHRHQRARHGAQRSRSRRSGHGRSRPRGTDMRPCPQDEGIRYLPISEEPLGL
jgi:hypothetical protein